MSSSNTLLIFMTLILSLLKCTVSLSNSIEFHLLEEQKANTFVGDVAEASGVRSEVAPANAKKLRYQILGSDGLSLSSLFIINSHSGMVYTTAMVNREEVCESAVVSCRLEFDVTVKLDASVLKIFHVVVVVDDINDNAPTFSHKSLLLSISESYPKGSDYSVSGAVDPDAQMGAKITYWIDENPVFELKEEKLLGVSLLKLVLLQDLDRENQSEYHLHIYAKDGDSSSALTGTLSLNITITDVNDNSPQFIQSTFIFNVSEDAEVNSFVGTVNASDLDSGENGRITFMFSPLTSNRVLQLFNLHPDTGVVSVKSTLEYESGRTFQAVIVAKDHGESAKASQTVLMINVLDVGNTPPQVSLILAAPMHQNIIVLSEDLPMASFVGRLRYQDYDEGDSGVVECLSLNTYFTLKPLEEKGFSIETKALLDRETENIMNVVLKCSDHGSPSLYSFVNFTVHVSDVNDNSPAFAISSYSKTVNENDKSQHNIIQISANDQDEGINKEVTYHLTMNSSNAFSIDPFTGWISLNSPVDREVEPIIYLTVEAVDKGKPSLTGSVTVTILVEDVNDNPPRVTRTEYQVKENELPGAFLAQIVATDSDDGVNGKLSFQLVSDSGMGFNVSRTGIITATRTFDRESVSYYNIVVSVSDSGSPSLSTTTTITITITDTNDHSPQIIYPWSGNDSLTVNANTSPGTVIATVSAIDLDTQRNAQLLYLIAEGNPRQLFNIDNSTGKIFLAKRLTSSRDTAYRLTISVQDGGNPRLHNNTFLYINVDFSNASFIDPASDLEQKYTIIAGVISGVTLIIAITIIAIIFKLRRMDPMQSPRTAPKLKEITFVTNDAKHAPEVILPQMSTFQIRSPKKEAAFPSDKIQDSGFNTSFPNSLTSGGVSGTHKLDLSQEMLGQQQRAYFCHVSEGRQRQTSEDFHSDSSGDATTSDSGRGTSDADDISSGVSLNSGASPAKFPTPLLSLKGPALVTLSSPGWRPNHVFTRDSSSLGDLSNASKVHTSHKDADKAQRTPSKVRFSFDDHNINRQRAPRHSTSSNQNQLNGNPPRSRLITEIHEEHNKPVKDKSTLYPVGNIQLSMQLSRRPPVNSHHINRDASDEGRGVNSFLLSREALLTHCNQLQVNLQGDAGSKHSFLPHHHPQQQQQPYNMLMSSLNGSTDEDDDVTSTTTSGSYAIDDPVSTSAD